MISATKINYVARCDSCKIGPPYNDGEMYSDWVMIDLNGGYNKLPLIYICPGCARKLRQQLIDILGISSEEPKPRTILGAVEKIISEADFIEMTLPDGTVIRANKFEEN